MRGCSGTLCPDRAATELAGGESLDGYFGIGRQRLRAHRRDGKYSCRCLSFRMMGHRKTLFSLSACVLRAKEAGAADATSSWNLTDRCWWETAVTVEQKRTNRIPTSAIANRLSLIYAQRLQPRVQIATSEALYESESSRHGDGGYRR